MTETGTSPRRALHARGREAQELTRFLDRAAGGQGGALVVHGEAGIGKTALVDRAVHGLPRTAVLHTTGVQFEMDIPHAALSQLCAPVLHRRADLPAPQRGALESVLGLGPSTSPDALLVGLAVLGLLAEAGREQPVVCVVDDTQWIDGESARALAFAARRVAHEQVAVLFVVRDPDARSELAGLPRLPLAGLSDSDARALLAAEIPVLLDDAVRDRIVAEARGNPLALVELPRSARSYELTGGFSGVPAGDVSGVVEQAFAARVAGLTEGARTLLLLAAAEPTGAPQLLERAARLAGTGPDAAAEAERSGLVSLGARVGFRHPLVRSVVYRGAGAEERRRAHAALAEATDAAQDADRRAWHLGQAARDSDEDTAAELERSAGRARSRGGLAAAAAFLQRAAELTPEPGRRAARHLAAAAAQQQAGATAAALAELELAEAGPLDETGRGYARLVRARTAFYRTRDAEATVLLLDAAAGLPTRLSRDTHLEVLASARWIDRSPGRVVELAERIGAQLPSAGPPRPVDLLLDALVAQLVRGDSTAVPSMRRAVAACLDDRLIDPQWLELTCQLAIDLYDDDAASTLADRQVALAREQGALTVLGQALKVQVLTLVLAGRLADADTVLAEAAALDEATGSTGLVFSDLILTAWRGDQARMAALLAQLRRGIGRTETLTELYTGAVLHNGLGDYGAALDAGLRAREQERLGSYVLWHLPAELVEAAARSGRPELAADSLQQLTDRAEAAGTDFALGVALQARALLTEGPGAHEMYAAAVRRLECTSAVVHLARARLVHGEWLRREQRRVEAREQLRAAHEAFLTTGTTAFAERAGRELRATGEIPRPRGADRFEQLTDQERHIARRVASGATTKEVAATLFLSPRTIDAHLRSIFRKLDITSRRQLRGLQL